MSHRCKKLVGVLCLAALGGGAGFIWHTTPQPSRASVAAQTPSASPITPRAWAFDDTSKTHQAMELEYAVDFETTTAVVGGTTSKLSGHLNLTLTEAKRTDQNLVVNGRLRDITIALDEGDEAIRNVLEQGLAKDLERDFALMLDGTGKLVQLGTPATLSPGTESVLRAVLSTLQFSAGPGGGAKTWRSQETDHYGAFNADYRSISVDQVEKVKSYTRLALSSVIETKEVAKGAGAKGKALFKLAPAGRWPLRVEAQDQLELSLVRLDQRFTLTLEAQRSVTPLPADLSRLRLANLDTVTTQQGGRDDGKAMARQLAGGISYAEAMTELGRFGNGEDDVTGKHAAVGRLIALFDSDPRAVAEALSSLRSGKAGKDTPALLGALASSDAAEARSALNTLAADRTLPAQLRNDVLNNMNVRPAATPETFATLTSLTHEEDPQLRKGALMALGSSVRGGEGDPSVSRDAERASRDLHRGFDGAQTPAERSLYLKALGNSGSTDALAAAKVALADENPAVRRDGVRALRFVPGPEADQLIAGTWLKDEDPNVREQGPFAATYRLLTPILAQAALASLGADAQESVRLRVVAFVAENRGKHPMFASALATAAEEDASAEVRQLARRYLGNI